MPESTPVEQTQRVLMEMGHYLETVGEVTSWQSYAGTAAPINFNGLVRQYYLRSDPYQGDIQVNLSDEDVRSRQSHVIAQALRDPLTVIGNRYDASVKIVEVPPGPPVLSPVVAEIYGVDPDQRAELARSVAAGMAEVQGWWISTPRWKRPHANGKLKWIAPGGLTGHISGPGCWGSTGGTGRYECQLLHDDHAKYPVPIRVMLDEGDKAQPSVLMSLQVRSRAGNLVPLASIAQVREADWMGAIYHKTCYR